VLVDQGWTFAAVMRALLAECRCAPRIRIITRTIRRNDGNARLLQHVGNYMPLGAAVQAMQEIRYRATFPAVRPLLVMAAHTVVLGVAAVWLFRWE
jgi:hypothetical protein